MLTVFTPNKYEPKTVDCDSNLTSYPFFQDPNRNIPGSETKTAVKNLNSNISYSMNVSQSSQYEPWCDVFKITSTTGHIFSESRIEQNDTEDIVCNVSH